ncbi:hypothetical protein COY07_02450 [Candidatus Peregrinibacteria bacterium CG_4_10_14_0_2_um_filter_43_11]|nr:MAG: hypothetical protein COY07_02450 [Candidatus Peregrinibacteria bacterium CG_4_10_14_0_2_um_filter_43_11]
MKLTQKQRDQLWGEVGPYSEAKLIIETRILDDRVSRVFVVVEVAINPLTFEIISKNKRQFMDDPMITQLIEHSENRGQNFGYVSMAFMGEYLDESVMKEAKKAIEYAKKTIVKMHKFVMDLLDL